MALETEGMLSLDSLVSVDVDLEPYVLTWPTHAPDGEDGSLEVYGLVVLKRQGGLLLAVPAQVLPQRDLDLGRVGTGILGPSTEAEVPAVIMDGGKVHATGGAVKVVVVDCSSEVFFPVRSKRLPMDSIWTLPFLFQTRVFFNRLPQSG